MEEKYMHLAHMTHYNDSGMPGHGDSWLSGLFGLFVLLILVGLVVYIVRTLANNRTDTAPDPLDIAKHRYAKGEITKDELADIKKELK